METLRAPIQILTLQPFELVVGGRALASKGKAPHKALLLLKTLVALGGERVPVQRMTDALWPESDGDAAHRAFGSTLHRLRSLLGREALLLSDTRLSLNRELCWVDSAELLAHLRSAREALSHGDAAQAHTAITRAAALYRAPFLDGEHEPPEILSTRKRLHAQFLETLIAVGDRVAASGQVDLAMALFRQGLESDDLCEELYRRLMRGCMEQGRFAEGLGLYQRCRDVLRANAGIAPSPETEAVHAALRNREACGPLEPVTGESAPRPVLSMPEPHDPKTAPPAAFSPAPPVVDQPERKHVVVLVSEIMRLTTPAAHPDPEELEARLEAVWGETTRIVEAHGGILNQFLQSRCVALFGVLAAHEDDAVRAVRAAELLQRLPASLPREAAQALAENLAVRSGVEAGVAIVRQREGRHGIVGEAAMHALHLVGRARPGEILVGEAAWPLVADYYETEALPDEGDRGEAAPRRAYRIGRRTPARTAFEAAERRGFSPFTGRRSELALLRECLGRAMAGQGQFVTISGEAGMGKSRLVHEFRHSLDSDRVTIWEGRCQAYGGVMPYLPFLDALRRGLGLQDDDPPQELRNKVIAHVTALGSELATYLPHYLHLLSIPDEDHPLPHELQGEALRRSLEDALTSILALSARRRPVVLVLEDWHWADEASETALRCLFGVVATHPILLIVLHRPEYDLRWSHVSHHTPIVLKSLERAESERIVRFTLGAAYLPDALGGTIHDRTGGNPLFVEEFARALAESGEVTVRDGEPWLTRGLDSLRLPRTVEATIRGRVDRLAPGAREALRLAAVIGHDFDRRILEALHSQRETLPQAMLVLRDQELIFQTRELPEPAYRFNHALTQVAVYESLLLQQRSELHGRVGQAIESLYAERLEEYYEALARHYGHSSNTEKAIDYLEKAGDKAARLFSLGQSRAYYREAIERIDSLESTAARKIRRIDLTIKWATASYYAPAPEAVPVLEVSRSYASMLEDEPRFWKLTYSMARVEYVRGSLIQALPLVNRCLELANALGEPSAVAFSHSLHGRICCFTGEYETGRRHLEASLPLLRELGNQDEESYALGFLALIHARLGDFDKGAACGAECRRLAETSNNKTRLAASGIYNGIVEYLRGEWAAAHNEFSRSWTLSREIGDLFIAGIARAFQGCARSMMGEREGAVDALMEGCGLIEKQGLLLSVNNVYAWCADAFVRLGHPDLARAYAKKALIRERFGERYGMAWAHRVLAIVEAGNTPSHWEDAEAHTRESLRWASALSQRPDEAVTRFRHAEILHKKGDRKRAMEQLAEAARLFRDMKMTWWMKQVEALGGRIERGEPFCWFTPVPDRPPAPSMRD